MGYCEGQQEAWIEFRFGQATGYACDVGANNGTLLSNTLLAEERGWTVLCVEGNPEMEERLRATRKLVEVCAASDFVSESEDFWVNETCPASGSSLIVHNSNANRLLKARVDTVDNMLTKHNFPRLDLLSVDVERSEMGVLRGANLDKWKPKMIIVETFWESDENRITKFLESFDYKRKDKTNVDSLFELEGAFE